MENYTRLLPDLTTFPILGTGFQPSDYQLLDLSIHHPAFENRDVTTYEGLDAYIQQFLQQRQAKVGYGGYGEHRIFYRQSPLFNDGKTLPRCIHLGVDLWSPAGTPVYAPLDAKVHSFRYNNQMLDYGATIILEHSIKNQPFYTLFGHLTLDSIQHLKKGQLIQKGEPFTAIGARNENGGWVPHLHFQVILNMEGWDGDYPGVATAAEAPHYLQNCPDPALFFPFLNHW